MDILPIAFYSSKYQTNNKKIRIMLVLTEIVLACSIFLAIIYMELRLLYPKSKAAK
tara:strand:- start:293 stop:460 length:168 start_codon:yes stop_codon:yes gene_type:complete